MRSNPPRGAPNVRARASRLLNQLPAWGAALGVFVTVTGCDEALISPAHVSPQLSHTQQPQNYSGEEIFRGLVFSHGKVARVIPEKRDHALLTNYIREPEHLKAVENLQARFIKQIRSDNPGYFKSFETALESGNPVAVDRALRDAYQVLANAASELPEVRELRAKLKNDPAFREKMEDALRPPRPDPTKERHELSETSTASASEIEAMMDAQFAAFLEGEPFALAANDEMTGAVIYAVVAAVAWVVAYAHFALAQDVVVALNVAATVNVYAAIFMNVVVAGGGGNDDPPPELLGGSGTPGLLYEQMVQSAATLLKST